MNRPVLLRSAAAGLLTAAFAFAQAPVDSDALSGSWQGTLVAGPQRLEVALHLTRDGERYRATFDSLSQGATGIGATSVQFDGTALTVVLPIGARFLATLEPANGETPKQLVGTWEQGPAKLPLRLRSVEKVEGPKRPQTPQPPFPYTIEEVRFGHDPARGLAASFHAGAPAEPTPTQVTLAGTLTVPAGEGPHPAVVLISGSGPQDRDETLMGHQPFWILADHLSRHGIAVLRYDDRGVGASTGDFEQATTADFAVDAAAALRFLATRDDVDAKRLGLVGHSEGGIVAPLVATGDDGARVAFVALLAPPAVNIKDVILHQSRLIARAGGAGDADVEPTVTLNDRILAAIGEHTDAAERAQAVRALVEAHFAERDEAPDDAELAAALRGAQSADTPWMHWLLRYEPTDALQKLRCPVLAVFGEKDLQVDPAQNRPPLTEALAAGGNEAVEVVTLEGLNHLLQRATTGAPTEYGTIEQTIAPEALERITTWLRAAAGLD